MTSWITYTKSEVIWSKFRYIEIYSLASYGVNRDSCNAIDAKLIDRSDYKILRRVPGGFSSVVLKYCWSTATAKVRRRSS